LSFRQYRDFDPAGSHQLPIAGSDEDQCSLINTPQLTDVFFEILNSFGASKILTVIGSFVTNQW